MKFRRRLLRVFPIISYGLSSHLLVRLQWKETLLLLFGGVNLMEGSLNTALAAVVLAAISVMSQAGRTTSGQVPLPGTD